MHVKTLKALERATPVRFALPGLHAIFCKFQGLAPLAIHCRRSAAGDPITNPDIFPLHLTGNTS
jgi:hypothetical protein